MNNKFITFSLQGWILHMPNIAEEYAVVGKHPTKAILFCRMISTNNRQDRKV